MKDVLRLIAGGLLALVACYVGVLIKKRYKTRVEFFKSACNFTQTLSTELSMKKTPMPDVAQKFLQGREGEFEKTVENWMSYIKRGEQITFEKMQIPLLKNEEKKQIVEFFSSLGKTDLQDQLAHVAYYQNLFLQKSKICEEESKKLGNMYFKLCVLLGIAIMLILA